MQHDLLHLAGIVSTIFPGICFYHSFYGFGLKFWPIQGKGVTFLSLSLPVIIKQTFIFEKSECPVSLCWSRWDNFESDPKICK